MHVCERECDYECLCVSSSVFVIVCVCECVSVFVCVCLYGGLWRPGAGLGSVRDSGKMREGLVL